MIYHYTPTDFAIQKFSNDFAYMQQKERIEVENSDNLQQEHGLFTESMTVENLRQILNVLYEDFLKKHLQLSNNNKENMAYFPTYIPKHEAVWEKMAEQRFNPPQKHLEDFLRALNENTSDKILNEDNMHVFFELANHLKIEWLLNDARILFMQPQNSKEFDKTLGEYLGINPLKWQKNNS